MLEYQTKPLKIAFTGFRVKINGLLAHLHEIGLGIWISWRRVKRRRLSQPTGKPLLSGLHQVALNAPQSESKRMGQGEMIYHFDLTISLNIESNFSLPPFGQTGSCELRHNDLPCHERGSPTKPSRVGHHTNLLLNGNDKQELERSLFILHSTQFSFCVMGECERAPGGLVASSRDWSYLTWDARRCKCCRIGIRSNLLWSCDHWPSKKRSKKKLAVRGDPDLD